jgi:hypothetical protein
MKKKEITSRAFSQRPEAKTHVFNRVSGTSNVTFRSARTPSRDTDKYFHHVFLVHRR